MRQATMVEPGRIEFGEIAAPTPGEGQVLLRIERIGVCGSDVHVNHGKHPFTGYPVVQGHEFSATVEAVGPGVKGVEPGMKATARPQVVCGECAQCKRGDYHICDTLKVEGFQAPGCAQDYFVTDADKVIVLPDSFTHEQGALVEPVSCGVHATGRVAARIAGHNVVVLGAGPIGNLVAQAARCRGARRVLIVDLSDYRLEKARACGLEYTSNATEETLAEASKRVFGDEGFDVAFEAVGVEATMTAAIETIGKGGVIVVVGVFGEQPRLNLALVQDRELSLVGTLMYKHEDYVQAVEWIRSGQVITGPLVTTHFSFEHYADAYRFIDDQRDKALKIMIDL